LVDFTELHYADRLSGFTLRRGPVKYRISPVASDEGDKHDPAVPADDRLSDAWNKPVRIGVNWNLDQEFISPA
jgi:4-hydroxy-3-methylbut-2-en-1-yl diphosphate synthase IspG/GcpE